MGWELGRELSEALAKDLGLQSRRLRAARLQGRGPHIQGEDGLVGQVVRWVMHRCASCLEVQGRAMHWAGRKWARRRVVSATAGNALGGALGSGALGSRALADEAAGATERAASAAGSTA
jgi:hypothetical protein